MPTKKLDDFNVEHSQRCTSHDHDPPTMQCFRPGTYEHTCSKCGGKIVFTVSGHYMANGHKLESASWSIPPKPPVDTCETKLLM